MKKLFLPLCCLVSLLSACTNSRPVSMDWIPTESHRDLGTLKLSIMWNPQHDKPEIDPQKALFLATDKCQFWGYNRAELLTFEEGLCTRRSTDFFSTCTRKESTATFRCVN